MGKNNDFSNYIESNIFNLFNSINWLFIVYFIFYNYIILLLFAQLLSYNTEIFNQWLLLFFCLLVFILMISSCFSKEFNEFLKKKFKLINKIYSEQKIGNISINTRESSFYIGLYVIMSLLFIIGIKNTPIFDIPVFSFLILLTIFKILIIKHISKTQSFTKKDNGQLYYFLLPILITECILFLFKFSVITLNQSIIGIIPSNFSNILINNYISISIGIVFIIQILFSYFYKKEPHEGSNENLTYKKSNNTEKFTTSLFTCLYLIITFITISQEKRIEQISFLVIIVEFVIIYSLIIYRYYAYHIISTFDKKINLSICKIVKIIGSLTIVEEHNVKGISWKTKIDYYKLTEEKKSKPVYMDKTISNALFKTPELFLHDKIKVYGFINEFEVKENKNSNKYTLFYPFLINIEKRGNLYKLINNNKLK